MSMYTILTTKAGHYRTEPAEGMLQIEAWDYLFFGKRRAHFVIAESSGAGKVAMIEEGEGGAVNHVPAKFLPHFASIDAARAELRHLAGFGSLETELVRSA